MALYLVPRNRNTECGLPGKLVAVRNLLIANTACDLRLERKFREERQMLWYEEG